MGKPMKNAIILTIIFNLLLKNYICEAETMIFLTIKPGVFFAT